MRMREKLIKLLNLKLYKDIIVKKKEVEEKVTKYNLNQFEEDLIKMESYGINSKDDLITIDYILKYIDFNIHYYNLIPKM